MGKLRTHFFDLHSRGQQGVRFMLQERGFPQPSSDYIGPNLIAVRDILIRNRCLLVESWQSNSGWCDRG
jgi:hypothetical protein